MLRHFTCLAATLLLGYATRSHAQTFEPGLLVRSTGDTLRGEIENEFWVEPPTSIRFRSTPDSPSQLFRPRQLRAVSFTQGRYFRYAGLPIDHAAQTQLAFLPLENQTNIKVDSLLAEVLIAGHATLLRVINIDVTHYLLLRPGQPVQDLSERKYRHKEGNGPLMIVDGNNYRAQLSQCFGDCLEAYVAAHTATFSPTGLATVVQAYNNFCGPTSEQGLSFIGRDRRQVAFRGGVLAGARYNHIESGYNNYSRAQVRPFAGLYGELFPFGRSVALYGDVTLSDFNGQGSTLYSSMHRVSFANNVITISDSAVYTYYT